MRDATDMEDSVAAPETERPRRVVVMDTDPGVRWAIDKGLTRAGFIVVTADTIGQVSLAAHEDRVDCIVMELLPEAGLTLEALSSFVDLPHAPRLVCISIESDPQTVIECMKRGAVDYLTKPFGLAELCSAVRRALREGRATRRRTFASESGAGGGEPSLLVGVSSAVKELRKILNQVAQTDLNCLIRGESGVGKDIVAREIHRLSERNNKPFIKVNCSALPEMLLESELFGYVKGAFTGAANSKPGRFNLAHKGIIFLDEIGDLHPSLQAKILQVIEHKEFTRLGATAPTKVDVQILAATNADLDQMTQDGMFRNDLYFRLNEICIWLPPLRDRVADVPLLVHHFIQKHNLNPDHHKIEISGEDLAALSKYDWPGNVRELESTVKRWLVLGVPLAAVTGDGKAGVAPSSLGYQNTDPEPEPPREIGPDEILAVLEAEKWNRKKAAEALGMSYQVLRRRIKRHGLDQTVTEPAPEA